MSTSVYKPLGLSFLAKSPDRIFCRSEVQKVKRVLFGPVDNTETQKFLEDELEKITVSQSENWNFDFKREKTLDPNGRYHWRPATPQKNIRPIKRRPSSEPEQQDFLYGQPTEIIRPTPIRPTAEPEMQSPPNSTKSQSPQRLITGKFVFHFFRFHHQSSIREDRYSDDSHERSYFLQLYLHNV